MLFFSNKSKPDYLAFLMLRPFLDFIEFFTRIGFEAFKSGWEFLLFVDGAFVVLGFYMRHRAKKRHLSVPADIAYWEDALKRLAFRCAIVLTFGYFFLFAPYEAFEKEHELRIKAETVKDNSPIKLDTADYEGRQKAEKSERRLSDELSIAQNELAQTKTELLSTKQQLSEVAKRQANRVILPEDAEKMIQWLIERKAHGKVMVQADIYTAQSQETLPFSQNIASVMQRAGFELQQASLTIFGINRAGVVLFVANESKPPSHAAILQQCFDHFKINVTPTTIVQQSAVSNDVVVVWVSVKP